jgi:hypothetical protein
VSRFLAGSTIRFRILEWFCRPVSQTPVGIQPHRESRLRVRAHPNCRARIPTIAAECFKRKAGLEGDFPRGLGSESWLRAWPSFDRRSHERRPPFEHRASFCPSVLGLGRIACPWRRCRNSDFSRHHNGRQTLKSNRNWASALSIRPETE